MKKNGLLTLFAGIRCLIPITNPSLDIETNYKNGLFTLGAWIL